jgi:hypothetical protein
MNISIHNVLCSPGSQTFGPVKLPTFEVDDEYDLIDEDSLLTEEDLKRPELPKSNQFFSPFDELFDCFPAFHMNI